jgi:hypothetical protein
MTPARLGSAETNNQTAAAPQENKGFIQHCTLAEAEGQNHGRSHEVRNSQ